MKNIIIIGAGLGGLFAGNLLAQKGHKVTLFEAHSMPGGYTAGFTRKGFYFESGTLNLEASASVFMAMREIGVLDHIEFVRLKTRFASEEFDGVPEDYDAYKNLIRSGFQSEKQKLDMAFSELDIMLDLMGNTDALMPFMCSGFKKIAALFPYILRGPKLVKLFQKYGDITASEFAARYFEKDSKLFRLFSGLSYPDVPPLAIGGALSSILGDVWAVKGGMQSWADVLAENFRKMGGELKLKAYVDKIITKNGAAVGVSCKDTVYNADYVISAGDYKKTFLKLLDNKNLVPQALWDKIDTAETSESFFTVYLGLNMSNEILGKAMKVPHIFACDKRSGYDIYNTQDTAFFNKTSATLYSPSLVNPKLAPEGKSSLMLQTMVPYRWMNNWGGTDKEAYKQLKEQAMAEMIENASTLIPGLKECIEYKDAATPLTYERFTQNTDGSSSAWSWNPKKKYYKSGMSVNIETPVKNLFIGSCWAMQIGGVPGALGAAYRCAAKVR